VPGPGAGRDYGSADLIIHQTGLDPDQIRLDQTQIRTGMREHPSLAAVL
jgi:hypothetical protein